MEDSGYLPRLAILTDNALKKIGLNGKAILPLILGLSCATMATFTTRILDTKKERLIAIILIALGIPCSAQLGIIMSMAGSVSITAIFILFFTVALQLLFVGFIANKLFKGEKPDFIIEGAPGFCDVNSKIMEYTARSLDIPMIYMDLSAYHNDRGREYFKKSFRDVLSQLENLTGNTIR